jgi:hypothetical protein
MKQSGADILRLWVMTTDYWEDQRLGKNVCRPMSTPIASCATPSAGCSARWRTTRRRRCRWPDMPELERLMLHRLAELDEVVRDGYDAFDFKRVARCSTSWWSSCRPSTSISARTRSTATRRRAGAPGGGAGGAPPVRPSGDLAGADAALHHGRGLAGALSDRRSVHLEQFPMCRRSGANEALAEKWRRSARCAASSPGARDRAGEEGDRLVAGGRARRARVGYCPDERAQGAGFRRDLYHFGHPCGRRRRAGSSVPSCRGAGCRSRDEAGGRDEVRPFPGASRRMSGLIPTTLKCRHEMPQPCVNWRPLAALADPLSLPDDCASPRHPVHLPEIGRNSRSGGTDGKSEGVEGRALLEGF